MVSRDTQEVIELLNSLQNEMRYTENLKNQQHSSNVRSSIHEDIEVDSALGVMFKQ